MSSWESPVHLACSKKYVMPVVSLASENYTSDRLKRTIQAATHSHTTQPVRDRNGFYSFPRLPQHTSYKSYTTLTHSTHSNKLKIVHGYAHLTARASKEPYTPTHTDEKTKKKGTPHHESPEKFVTLDRIFPSCRHTDQTKQPFVVDFVMLTQTACRASIQT